MYITCMNTLFICNMFFTIGFPITEEDVAQAADCAEIDLEENVDYLDAELRTLLSEIMPTPSGNIIADFKFMKAQL